jgi:hypothetical protein
MRFSLEVIRARKGDCLMLHYGTEQEPRLMLIDGGPSGVFGPHLTPRIEAVRAARELEDQDSLPVDVLMLSHVDDDHIKGILELTRDLREQKGDREPLWVRVASLWHNSFDDLLGTTPEELEVEASYGAASLSGDGELPHGEDFDVAMVLASIPQGRTLRDDAEFLGWRSNHEFAGRLILATQDSQPFELDGGLEITVVGPLQAELIALQKAHDKWLKDQKKKRETDPDAALAAFTDRSVPNLSSLVMLVKAGGKTILITGDARGDKILEGLVMKGLLDEDPESTLHVDVLKVPHHGSANNVETRFFERVTADHYVFSGDGKHGNPERETLEMLFAARGQEPFELHFTYPIDEIDAEREKDWTSEQAKEKKRGKKVRTDWSDAKHSLASFFAKQRLAPGQSIHIVPEDAPHLIELLDATKL